MFHECDRLPGYAACPSEGRCQTKKYVLTYVGRNANILPSITTLTGSALQQMGINQEAKTFQSTTGSQDLKTLQQQKAV